MQKSAVRTGGVPWTREGGGYLDAAGSGGAVSRTQFIGQRVEVLQVPVKEGDGGRHGPGRPGHLNVEQQVLLIAGVPSRHITGT